MEEKRFQIIDWSESNFQAKRVKLTLSTYDSYNDIEKVINEKNYVIAVGYNPSNKTIFNDDETNLYLRDKIANRFKNDPVDGYILVNLIPYVTSKSSNIHFDDVKDEYIEDIVKLIESKKRVIVLFFGKIGLKIIEKNNEKFKALKQAIINSSDEVYYTCSNNDFIHPAQKNNNYEIKEWKDGLLDI